MKAHHLHECFHVFSVIPERDGGFFLFNVDLKANGKLRS